MSDFKTYALSQETLDPTKRVYYSTGLVLGVDEFMQQDLYFIERDRLHNRSLHGYGTVCGLAVSQRSSSAGPEIVVTPGIAVNPQGQEIRVPVAQCARIDAWLARHRDEVQTSFGSPPGGPVALNVVLCYRACETDLVPIPGEPCRTQEDSMAPSRLADDFQLSLEVADPLSPDQVEETITRRFGDLLCRIRLSNTPGTLDAAQMVQLVRDLLTELPGVSPPDDLLLGSPLVDDTPLLLHPSQAEAILRQMFNVWVTEVRPALLACGKNCAGGPPDETCVLLARIEFDVAEGGDGNLHVVIGGAPEPVTIDESRRPYLLHTRLLQEWLLCGRSTHVIEEAARTFASLFVLDPTTIRAWVHHPVLLDIPTAAVTVNIEDSSGGLPPQLTAVTQPSPPGVNVFDLILDAPLADDSRVTVSFDTTAITELSSLNPTLAEALTAVDYTYLDQEGDDILAYLLVDRPALDDLSDVDAAAPADGNVLTQRGGVWVAEPPQGIQPGDTAGGDLRGTYPNPAVDGLQGRPIRNQAPNVGEVLTWVSDPVTSRTFWQPAPVATPSLNLDDLNDVDAPSPADGEVLTWVTGTGGTAQWQPAAPAAGVTDHGALTGLGDDDHPQYLLADGSRPLSGNLSAGNNRITNLAAGAAPGHAVRFQQAVKVNDPAGGDLGGSYPNPSVDGLQGHPVSPQTPAAGDVLTWVDDPNVGRFWQPAPPQTGPTTGTFVQIPPAAGAYAIVAAGYFAPDGTPLASDDTPLGSGYNNLQAAPTSPGSGIYDLTFDGYQTASDITYVVKGTGMPRDIGAPPLIFQVLQFRSNGILIFISDPSGQPVSTRFMVEISVFGNFQRILG